MKSSLCFVNGDISSYNMFYLMVELKLVNKLQLKTNHLKKT